MATSGSSNWSGTAGDIIGRAYKKLGRQGQTQTTPGELTTTALFELNGFLKSLRNQGAPLHALFLDSFAVVADDADYTLDPRILSVSNVRFRPTGGSDRMLYELSRSAYLDMPNKTSSGDPSQFYLDQQRASSVMYIWPVPSTASGAVHYSAELVLEDLDATTDDFDLPQEHLHMIVHCLARELAPEFTNVDSPRIMRLIGRADQLEDDYLTASRPAFYEFVPDC